MIDFYEAQEDLALRGTSKFPRGTSSRWYQSGEPAAGMDVSDSFDGPMEIEDDYRDERDDSSRLADRHGC